MNLKNLNHQYVIDQAIGVWIKELNFTSDYQPRLYGCRLEGDGFAGNAQIFSGEVPITVGRYRITFILQKVEP